MLKRFLDKSIRGLHEGHNLVKLCKNAIPYNNTLKDFIKDMAFVNTYYIETRYPAEDPLHVSNEDAEECITITKKITQKIEETF